MDPSGIYGFDQLAVDGPNPVGVPSAPSHKKRGRPPKEDAAKGALPGASVGDKMALLGDPPGGTAVVGKDRAYSTAEHIELTKKKDAQVKKALGVDFKEPSKSDKSDKKEDERNAEEKKGLLRQIAQYRKSFSVASNKKLSLSSTLEEIQEEYEEIQRELSNKGSLEAARMFLIAGMHALEHLNAAYDPIGLRLDGLGQATVASMPTLQPILEELIIKYASVATLGPEARLSLALAQTVLTVHAANKNPELMQETVSAASAAQAPSKEIPQNLSHL